jgi:RimJ/RimL family protein N-acetyltransferase
VSPGRRIRAEDLLAEHLDAYLGGWPPGRKVDVVASRRRLEPAWDGGLVLAVVVASPAGIVISVPPAARAETEALVDRVGSPAFADELAAAVGAPKRASPWLVLRWTGSPAALRPVGMWVEPTHPGLPKWLRPFPSPVLVAFDERGAFLAGLGIKPHTRAGRELAVGTEEEARGRGLARRLVAQAAHHVLAEGGVPLYVHHPANAPSARVADGAGFPDLGWRTLVVAAPPGGAP